MDTRIRFGFLLTVGGVVLVAPAHAQAGGTALPPGVTPEVVEKGKAIYSGAGLCYACHGKNGEGLLAPTTKLVDHDWIHSKGTYPEIVEYIKKGVTKEESKSGIPMPPRGGSKISDEDVNAVAAYVYTISRKKS